MELQPDRVQLNHYLEFPGAFSWAPRLCDASQVNRCMFSRYFAALLRALGSLGIEGDALCGGKRAGQKFSGQLLHFRLRRLQTPPLDCGGATVRVLDATWTLLVT